MIISAIDNENNRWKRKATKNKDKKEQRGDARYSESVRAKWFCCAFKLGFLQLIFRGSLIFKSNWELALSIILKQNVAVALLDVTISGMDNQNLTL